jgi:DNA-binding PadR family transcriptional regulator
MGGSGGRITRGRKFDSDELQLMLLALLEGQPRHGYELIKELDTRSNGFYSPSPGMVYPALTYLEELDYATVEAHGNRKLYHLAEAGRQYLDASRERITRLFAGLDHMARKMAWIKKVWNGEANADTDDGSGWLPEFVEARRGLKTALMHSDGATPDEQRRIAAILRRATTEILREDAPASHDKA